MAASRREPLWSWKFVLVVMTGFSSYAAVLLYLPTLPIYVKAIGGSSVEVGLTAAFGTFTMVVAMPYLGTRVDRAGRKKILTWGLITFFSATLLYNLTSRVWHLLLVRILHGLGWSGLSTACNALVADLAPVSRRGEAIGFYGLANTLAMAMGPLVGLTLAREQPPHNFTALFLTSSGMAFLGLILSLGLPETRAISPPASQELSRQGSGAEQAGSLLPRIKGSVLRHVLWPCTSMALMVVAYASIMTFISLYAGFRQVKGIGWFFTTYALSLMVSRPLAGTLSDIKGRPAIIIPGMAGTALALFLLALANNLTSFLVAAALLGLGFGAAQACLMALTVDLAPPGKRGAAVGLFGASFDLGMGLGALLAAWIVQHAGYQVMYSTAASLVLLGVASFSFVGLRRRRQPT